MVDGNLIRKGNFRPENRLAHLSAFLIAVCIVRSNFKAQLLGILPYRRRRMKKSRRGEGGGGGGEKSVMGRLSHSPQLKGVTDFQ